MEKSIPSLSRSAILPNKPNPSGIHCGKSNAVMTNFYRLTLPKKQMTIFVYSVTFKPEIAPDDRRRKYGLMKRLCKSLMDKGVCDWCSYLNNQLFTTSIMANITVSNAMWKDGSQYHISLIENHSLSLDEFSADNAEDLEILRVMIVEIKDRMRKLRYKQITRGSTFFDNESIRPFKDNWDIYSGFYVPCRLIENGVAVQIALKTKLISRDSVLDKLNELRDRYGKNYMKEAKEVIVGRSVRTKYGNNRHWRINDIDFTKNPNDTFECEEKGSIKFSHYYRERYGVEIRDSSQPLLVNIGAKDNKLTYLIPELVSLAGFSESEIRRYRGELNRKLFMKTQARVDKSSHLADDIRNCQSLLNVQVSKNPIKVESILMDPPVILLGNKGKAMLINSDREFTLRERLYDPAIFKENTWVCVHERNDNQFATELLDEMNTLSSGLGIAWSNPEIIKFDSKNWQNELQNCFRKIKESGRINFSLTLMPSWLKAREQAEYYNYIKRIAYKECPIPNQVVLSSILSGSYQSKITKLLIGINAKKGNAPWRVLTFRMDPAMIIGVDVCHSLQKGIKRSFLGFCATMSSSFTDVYSLTHPIAPGQLLMDGLKNCLHNAFAQFLKKYDYQVIPKLFLIYRDGVGEGMFNAVIEAEIKQVTDYIIHQKTELGINPDVWKPEIIYITVNKRVNTRLFSQEFQGSLASKGIGRPIGVSSEASSAHSGTLVTSGITGRKYDFYLISQKVTQGSAIPTHYNVLYDSSALEPEKLYILTYRLCFLDYNWMGGIRIPAPCHYAHKIAFMAANHVGDETSHELANTLFYL